MAGSTKFVAIYHAYVACRQHKRATRAVRSYELRLLNNLVDTAQALNVRSWRPHRSVYFVTLRPKAREIHAADFSDRVVHHYLVPRLEALYEPIFIHDSYSNRQGKGTHAAVLRLQHFERQITLNNTCTAYYLQLDIANFFNTVDRRRLYILIRNRLRRSIRDGQLTSSVMQELLWLTGIILADDPGKTSQYLGDPARKERVPPHKRLSEAPSGQGLPIGNLTSQFFANVYLHELDQFIKHTLHCHYYLRYVDDFVLLHEDPKQLTVWRTQIVTFLAEQLGLALRDDGFLHRISEGADFLGYIVRPTYLLVRRRVAVHLDEKLRAFEDRLLPPKNSKLTRPQEMILTRAMRTELQATLASYLGHYRHAAARRLAQWAFTNYPWLNKLFKLHDGLCLKQLWEPLTINSLQDQWQWFQRRWPDHLVLVQVGNCVEIYDKDAERLHQHFDLPLQVPSRPGFKCTITLPLVKLRNLRSRLRRLSLAYVFVVEDGWLRGGRKRRVLRIVSPHIIPVDESPLLITFHKDEFPFEE